MKSESLRVSTIHNNENEFRDCGKKERERSDEKKDGLNCEVKRSKGVLI
jgi:hypothetical protein